MLSKLRKILRSRRQLVEWHLKGKPSPPPHLYKQKVVKEYQKRYDLPVLIETGTFLGEMVDAVKRKFLEIYSIELSESLADKATRHFSRYDHIHIVQGDSSKKLPDILPSVDKPCLFWLDGHFSGGMTAQGEVDYPIINELTHIKNRLKAGGVILIDDARLFTGKDGVPSIQEIEHGLREINPGYQIELKNDIIRATIQ